MLRSKVQSNLVFLGAYFSELLSLLHASCSLFLGMRATPSAMPNSTSRLCRPFSILSFKDLRSERLSSQSLLLPSFFFFLEFLAWDSCVLVVSGEDLCPHPQLQSHSGLPLSAFAGCQFLASLAWTRRFASGLPCCLWFVAHFIIVGI